MEAHPSIALEDAEVFRLLKQARIANQLYLECIDQQPAVLQGFSTSADEPTLYRRPPPIGLVIYTGDSGD